MKLATMSIPSPRIITRLPSPLKLASSYSANAIGRSKKIPKHKPLLQLAGDDQLSDGSSSSHSRRKVPKGFIAVYVGPESRRFVIPISFLAMPDFRVLMEMVADEFGWDHHGALEFPCDEEHFEQILMTCFARQQMIASKNSKKLTW